MILTATTFLCIVLCSQVNGLPFLSQFRVPDPVYSPSLPPRNYGFAPNGPVTYVQYQTNPLTGEQVPTHYITHTRPGGPITALIQNVLNTVGRLVGDVGGAVGNVLGGTLAGAGQLGQDIMDFTKPITVTQILRPHPDPPFRPLLAIAPPPPLAIAPPPPPAIAPPPPLAIAPPPPPAIAPPPLPATVPPRVSQLRRVPAGERGAG